MMKTTLSALAVAISMSAAHAQSADQNRTSSTADVNYARTGTPGTIGAMDAVVRGIATSPEDVVLQQRGHGTLADGARPLGSQNGVEAAGYSPGTVGAAPGAPSR